MIGPALRSNLTTLGYVISGYPMLPHLKFLRQSQYWDRARMEEYQLSKLSRLIKYAQDNIPYYRDAFAKVDIRVSDIKSVSEISKIPVLTKSLIRQNFPDNLLSQKMRRSDILVHKTGGSTGEPLTFGYDKTTMGMVMALVYRSFEWFDFSYGDRILYFVGMGDYKKTIREKLKENLADKIVINAYYLEEEKLRQYYHLIEKAGIKVLYGYPSAIAVLCSYCQAHNLRFSRRLLVVTTGEVLTSHHRHIIESYFGYKIYDQYGCREINSVSFEAPDGGGMYINSEHVLVEVLDDNNYPVPIGEEGNVVVTDLDNYAMPFLRYRYGDRGRLQPREGGEAGIQLERMDFVQGRDNDVLYKTDRTPVTGIYFIKLMRGGIEDMVHYNAQGIHLFQVIQKRFDHIVLNIVTDKGGSVEAETELIEAFRQKLGSVQVTVNWVAQIPASKSGKRRMIISEIN